MPGFFSGAQCQGKKGTNEPRKLHLDIRKINCENKRGLAHFSWTGCAVSTLRETPKLSGCSTLDKVTFRGPFQP